MILGFPANNFLFQEPGTEAEIKAFCRLRYDVTFPMFEKLEVKGPSQHPLYKALTGPDARFPGDVKWNFEKFLVGRDGRLLARYPSGTRPDDKGLLADIAAAL